LVRAVAALIVAVAAAGSIPSVASAHGIPWFPWQSQELTPAPPGAEGHAWDSEIGIDPTGNSWPIDLLGSADIAVRERLALAHWTASVGPITSSTAFVGSSKSTGTAGDWDVYFNIYNVEHTGGWLPIGIPYRCEYHARVTGTYRTPQVSELSPPVCGTYRRRVIGPE
jgi:hypothetical protein